MFPVSLTKNAIEKAIAARDSEGLNDTFYLTISVKGGGCSGFSHSLAFSDEIDEDYITSEVSSDNITLKVATDSFSAMYLSGVTMDYTSENLKEGFKFTGGVQKSQCACGSSFKV